MKYIPVNDIVNKLYNVYVAISKRGFIWFIKRQGLKIYLFVSGLIDSLPYSAKKRAKKKFEKYIHDDKLYFSASVKKHGLTDQLFSLTFIYTIGHQLGLNYTFDPPHTSRSEPNLYDSGSPEKLNSDGLILCKEHFNIYDFIGVNDFFKGLAVTQPNEELAEVVLDLDELEFSISAFRSFGHFLDELRLKMLPYIDPVKNTRFVFKALPIAFKCFTMADAYVPDEVNFREMYSRRRDINKINSLYQESKIKLLIHIRQGDTSIIKTPWDTYIPTWQKIDGYYTEFDKKKDIDTHENIEVDEFYRFLKDLFKHIDADKFSSLLFSDGFHTAFDKIKSHKTKVGGQETQIHMLDELQKVYDDQVFKKFYEWDVIKTIVGEERNNLFNLIHSFTESDIVVIGTQQKMVPKLLKLYFEPENMPFLITLYKKQRPYVNYLGIGPEYKYMLNVDMDNYNPAQIAASLNAFLKERNLA